MTTQPTPYQRMVSTGVLPAVGSLLVPGLGQILCERYLRGAIWLAVAVLGYLLLVVPGVLVHLASVVDAILCSRKSYVCPMCMSWIHPDARRCPSCHADLPGPPAPTAG